ncbi:MAG: single-stranded-DNA-specific exonuclease RecJ [Epulopiscium sp. Nuni2H_MBin003]|nr:MAG: single-stranded-DNA-specific exonuclease RecJ [Epulopiscium sp. Nuni2H_MBin003]
MIPNKYKWQIRQDVSVENIVNTLLESRGVVDKDKFLNSDIKDLYDPFLLKGMKSAVQRILQARDTNESVIIYGDYDVDGITSTSILYSFLKEINVNVGYYIPSRTKEGYGLNEEAVQKIAKVANLIITVDNGIASMAEVKLANTLNLDIIITDHHDCHAELPPAFCIINPKQPDCQYPFNGLAGVGVAFKLIQAIAQEVNMDVLKYIELVSVGTVADIVPLVDENRILTAIGLKMLENTQNKGLAALLSIINKDNKQITSDILGYQIGPRVNAISRLSDAKIAVELFTTDSAEIAQEIAIKLDDTNKRRKSIENEIFKQAVEYIENNNLVDNDVLIVLGDGWNHGVIGIVASRIVDKYYKPTIIFTLENGKYTGSARSIVGFNMFKALAVQEGYMIKYGGHPMAAGMSIAEENMQAFIEDMKISNSISEDVLTPKLDIDI